MPHSSDRKRAVRVKGPNPSQSYDYVIVGAGAAGCAMARRLSDAGFQILLLEAGGRDNDWRTSLPFLWPEVLRRRKQHWVYKSPADESKISDLLAGKVLGGSSSVNALAFVRGHSSDYDGWADLGLSGFGYDEVLPYFRRMERWEGGEDAFRGDQGPVSVERTHLGDVLTDAFMASALAAGFGLNDDYNGAEQEGFGPVQATIRRGRRCSAADAYLREPLANGLASVANAYLHRPINERISVVTRAHATRIEIQSQRAVGVHYLWNGEERYAEAARELILASGAIQTPTLLMLSGIGDPNALNKHEIPIKAALSGVGQNLQNHISVVVRYERKAPGLVRHQLRYDRLMMELAQSCLSGTGLFSTLPTCATGFVRTSTDLNAPDIQISCMAAADNSRPYLPLQDPKSSDGFSVRAMLLRPRAIGKVSLVSRNPLDSPQVRQGSAEMRDLNNLAKALGIINQIADQPAMASIIESSSITDIPNDISASIDYVKGNSSFLHHPCGTCRMGNDDDPAAVVSPDFRMKAINGVRIVDASVMPSLVGGNIYACVTMLAEKASDDVIAAASR